MAKLKQRGVSRHVINPPKTSHAPFTASHTKLNAKFKKKKKSEKCEKHKRWAKKVSEEEEEGKKGKRKCSDPGQMVPQPRCPSQSCPSLASNF